LLLYSLVCFDQYRTSIDVEYKISTENLKKIFREKPSNLVALKAEFKENMKLFVEAIKNSQFPARDKYPYHIPSKIQNLIHKCLDSKIENRYNNFYEIQKDLNDFIFPRDVSGLVKNLTTKNIEFEKDGKNCVIEIINDGSKFAISSTKNGRSVTKCTKSGIAQTKLEKQLFKFVEEI